MRAASLCPVGSWQRGAQTRSRSTVGNAIALTLATACTSLGTGGGDSPAVCEDDLLIVDRGDGQTEVHRCESGVCAEEPQPHCTDGDAAAQTCCVPAEDWGFIRRDCDTGTRLDREVYLDVRCKSASSESDLCTDGHWRCSAGASEECIGGLWQVRSGQPAECGMCGYDADGNYSGEWSCACSPPGAGNCPETGGDGDAPECDFTPGGTTYGDDYTSCSIEDCYEAFKFCQPGDVWGACVCCDLPDGCP